MTDRHKVKPGEHLFRIAREHGFRTIRPLVEDPGNADLLRRRVNSATLVEGDEVVIPAFDPKEADGATDRFNVFRSRERSVPQPPAPDHGAATARRPGVPAGPGRGRSRGAEGGRAG
ncbi:MAG: hypothetical protein R2882_05995 [Gemmatimonadales bacterium]